MLPVFVKVWPPVTPHFRTHSPDPPRSPVHYRLSRLPPTTDSPVRLRHNPCNTSSQTHQTPSLFARIFHPMPDHTGRRSITIHRPGDRLRVGRHSIPGRCYFITKRVHNRNNPIIRDPRHFDVDSNVANVLIDSLRWMHKQGRIRCHAYVIMPDHSHLLFALGSRQTLSQFMSSYMSWTARHINKVRNMSGRFWSREYHDSRITSRNSFWGHLSYIKGNPVKAGYVERSEDWPYVDTNPGW